METKKIWVGSDFHLEGKLYKLPSDMPDSGLYDYILLAGDMAFSRGVHGVLSNFTGLGAKVIFVPGNHEYWDGSMVKPMHLQRESMRTQCEEIGVQFLDNTWIDLDETEYSVWGATWFTDYARLSAATRKEGLLEKVWGIGDYHHSWVLGKGDVDLLSPADHIQMNKVSKACLNTFLTYCKANGRKPIVLTHFAPSVRSVHPHHPIDDPYSAYFVTDWLDKNHKKFPPGSIWVHGHTHWNVDYQLGNVRVLSNQYGYQGETACQFTYSPTKYLEVPVK